MLVAPLVLALVLAAAACGGEPSADAGSSSPTAPTTAQPEILAFSAPALAGGRIDGVDYTGEDLSIWFWAPW